MLTAAAAYQLPTRLPERPRPISSISLIITVLPAPPASPQGPSCHPVPANAPHTCRTSAPDASHREVFGTGTSPGRYGAYVADGPPETRGTGPKTEGRGRAGGGGTAGFAGGVLEAATSTPSLRARGGRPREAAQHPRARQLAAGATAATAEAPCPIRLAATSTPDPRARGGYPREAAQHPRTRPPRRPWRPPGGGCTAPPAHAS